MSKRSFLSGLVLLVVLGAAAPDGRALGQAPDPATNVSNAIGLSSAPAAVQDASATIHVAWADNPGSDDTTVQQVYYARSFDGGTTFESPRRVSSGVDAGVRPREIRLAVSPSGAVTIAWWAVVDEGADREFLTAFVAQSTNGGAAFAPAQATSLRFRNRIVAPKEGFANTTSLSLAAGSATEVFLLATVQDYFHGFNVYFARSEDGSTFAEPDLLSAYTLTIPRAAANGLGVLPSGEIVAFWSEAHGDFVDEVKMIFRCASTDGGRTFSAPQLVARAQGVVGAVFALENGVTALLAQLQRTARAKGVLKLFRSDDAGRTFGGRAKVGSSSAYVHANRASIASNASGTVAIAWTENSSRPGPAEGLYVAVSRDGGRTFSAPALMVPGLFIDPPAVTVAPDGAVGLVYAAMAGSLVTQDVLFRHVP